MSARPRPSHRHSMRYHRAWLRPGCLPFRRGGMTTVRADPAAPAVGAAWGQHRTGQRRRPLRQRPRCRRVPFLRWCPGLCVPPHCTFRSTSAVRRAGNQVPPKGYATPRGQCGIGCFREVRPAPTCMRVTCRLSSRSARRGEDIAAASVWLRSGVRYAGAATGRHPALLTAWAAVAVLTGRRRPAPLRGDR